MIYNFKDLKGQRFGRLVVLRRAEDYISPKGYKTTQWLCKCDCGNEIIVSRNCLQKGNTRSCGCLAKEIRTKHGFADTRLHIIWKNIKQRCYNKNFTYYYCYGERGITMCDEWLNDFKTFYDWAMLNGYNKDAKRGECTLDRIDNNKGYCPENCRWITIQEQAHNRRTNHFITYNDETHTVKQWAKIFNIKNETLLARLNIYKWSIEKALTTPVKSSK